MNGARYEIEELDTDEVSLVDRPAIRRTWLIVKAEDAMKGKKIDKGTETDNSEDNLTAEDVQVLQKAAEILKARRMGKGRMAMLQEIKALVDKLSQSFNQEDMKGKGKSGEDKEYDEDEKKKEKAKKAEAEEALLKRVEDVVAETVRKELRENATLADVAKLVEETGKVVKAARTRRASSNTTPTGEGSGRKSASGPAVWPAHFNDQHDEEDTF